jgi:hypothetical protein
MKFVTYSQSVYEVDTDNKQIRRLTGITDPQPRQGKDGEFKSYKELYLKLGESAVIFWDPETTTPIDPNRPGVPTTVTNIVIKIIE